MTGGTFVGTNEDVDNWLRSIIAMGTNCISAAHVDDSSSHWYLHGIGILTQMGVWKGCHD